jgi:hypothetical protein
MLGLCPLLLVCAGGRTVQVDVGQAGLLPTRAAAWAAHGAIPEAKVARTELARALARPQGHPRAEPPEMGLGHAYAGILARHPVWTKAVTSGVLFGVSDATGQAIENGPADFRRALTSALVGLACFGPALHYWLLAMTTWLPDTGLLATAQKTFLGQLFFGPSFTIVFFGAVLVSNHGLFAGLRKWPAKIRQDFLRVSSTGLCYWVLVDFVCYGVLLRWVGAAWLPLSYNIANFFWTIFLSLQASRRVADSPK